MNRGQLLSVPAMGKAKFIRYHMMRSKEKLYLSIFIDYFNHHCIYIVHFI